MDSLKNNYKKLIIQVLIKKYEKSNIFKTREEQQRRIMVKTSDFKKVDFENYEQKSTFFEALKDLKDDALLDYSWIRFEEGNLLKAIWLNQDQEAITRAYKVAGLEVTYNVYEKMVEALNAYAFKNYDWMVTLKQDLIQRFDRSGKFGNLLTTDPEIDSELIRCMIELDKLSFTSVHERVFSASVFGDSKFFQNNLKSRLESIIRRYNEMDEDVDALQMVCLYTNPELIYFCGPIHLVLESGNYDALALNQGAVLLGNYVREIRGIKPSKSIRTIISIENRATYELMIQHKPEQVLLVYHGGFASGVKRQFFASLYRAFPEADYYHWSDIDLGGVRILRTLKNIIPKVKPMLMDEATLSKHRSVAIEIHSSYKEKIKRMLENEMANDKDSDRDCSMILEGILKHGVRLEQENIDVSHESLGSVFLTHHGWSVSVL